jgi:hypothetical protein
LFTEKQKLCFSLQIIASSGFGEMPAINDLGHHVNENNSYAIQELHLYIRPSQLGATTQHILLLIYVGQVQGYSR